MKAATWFAATALVSCTWIGTARAQEPALIPPQGGPSQLEAQGLFDRGALQQPATGQPAEELPVPEEISPGTELPGQAGESAPQAAANDIDWRYKQYNGRWWYWLPSKRWVFWHEGRWVDYDPATIGQYRRPASNSGMRYRAGPGYQVTPRYDDRYRRDYVDRRDLLNPPVDRGVGSYYGRYYPFYPYYSGAVGGVGWGPYGAFYGSSYGIGGGYYGGSVGFGTGGRW